MPLSSPLRSRVHLATCFALLLPLAADPARATEAGELCDGGVLVDPCIISGNLDVEDFSLLDFEGAEVILSGTLDVDSGSMDINAGRFEITSSGQIKGVGGTSDVGGQIVMTITGDVVIDGTAGSGAVFITGKDGGTLDITAGGSITGSGKVNAEATPVDGFGGEIALTAASINYTGELTSAGGAGAFGLGGVVEIAATTGPVILAEVDVRGGEGGIFDVFQGTSVELGTVIGRGVGTDGFGSDVSLSSSGTVTWDLIDLDSGGADGGSLGVFADGIVTVGDVEASGGGDSGLAGAITVTTTNAADIVLPASAEILARGANNLLSGGDGGTLDLSAGSPASPGNVTVAGSVELLGRGANGCGGTFFVAGGDITLSGSIAMSGSSFTSCGGLADVDATGVLDISGEIDADHGDSSPANLDLYGIGGLDLTGTVHADAKGNDTTAGDVVLRSDGLLQLMAGSSATANGANPSTGSGGGVVLEGCRVDVASGVAVEAEDGFGDVVVRTRGSVQSTLAGAFLAGPEGIGIALRHRDPETPPDTTGASFSPTETVTHDPTLLECDSDEDTVGDDTDNCLLTPNPTQDDADFDGQGDVCDNCLLAANGPLIPDAGGNVQLDVDGDGFGNMCDCDFNNDPQQRCNADDFNIFLPEFSSGSDSGIGTDMDGSGAVNASDFNIFLPGFAAGVPGP